MLDAAHQKTAESSPGPKREDIIESILFKSSDFVMVQFKDMDSSYARKGTCFYMLEWFMKLASLLKHVPKGVFLCGRKGLGYKELPSVALES